MMDGKQSRYSTRTATNRGRLAFESNVPQTHSKLCLGKMPIKHWYIQTSSSAFLSQGTCIGQCINNSSQESTPSRTCLAELVRRSICAPQAQRHGSSCILRPDCYAITSEMRVDGLQSSL